jgi:hypothetical protein
MDVFPAPSDPISNNFFMTLPMQSIKEMYARVYIKGQNVNMNVYGITITVAIFRLALFSSLRSICQGWLRSGISFR